MQLLILGGTVFLGRSFVETARGLGHDVTIFTCGQQGADLFPDVEKRRRDRDGHSFNPSKNQMVYPFGILESRLTDSSQRSL